MNLEPLIVALGLLKSKINFSTKKTSLLSLQGKNKKSGLYKDAKESDRFITKLRDEWD